MNQQPKVGDPLCITKIPGIPKNYISMKIADVFDLPAKGRFPAWRGIGVEFLCAYGVKLHITIPEKDYHLLEII